MNNFLKISLIGLSFLLFSCKEEPKIDTLKIGETVEIKLNETVKNTQRGLSLQVMNINDSRCPTGTECVWEGNAFVEFTLTTNTVIYHFILDTHEPPNFKNDTLIDGLKYQLIDVSPYPTVANEGAEKVVKILVGEGGEN